MHDLSTAVSVRAALAFGDWPPDAPAPAESRRGFTPDVAERVRRSTGLLPVVGADEQIVGYINPDGTGRGNWTAQADDVTVPIPLVAVEP